MWLGCGHGLLIASITWSIPALVRCTSQESAGSAQRGARGNMRELSASSDGFCERLNGNLDELYAEQRRLAADIAAIESAALRGGCVPSSGTPMVQILPVHADSVHRIGSPTRRRANYTLLTVRTSGRPRMAACFRGRASIACTRRPAFDRLAPGSTCQTSPARLSLAAVYRSQPARRGARLRPSWQPHPPPDSHIPAPPIPQYIIARFRTVSSTSIADSHNVAAACYAAVQLPYATKRLAVTCMHYQT